MKFPFIGPSYTLNARKADVQRTVNLFPVVREVAGTKSIAYLDSVPGLSVFSPYINPEGALLLEDGAYLLLESGGRILLE